MSNSAESSRSQSPPHSLESVPATSRDCQNPTLPTPALSVVCHHGAVLPPAVAKLKTMLEAATVRVDIEPHQIGQLLESIEAVAVTSDNVGVVEPEQDSAVIVEHSSDQLDPSMLVRVLHCMHGGPVSPVLRDPFLPNWCHETLASTVSEILPREIGNNIYTSIHRQHFAAPEYNAVESSESKSQWDEWRSCCDTVARHSLESGQLSTSDAIGNCGFSEAHERISTLFSLEACDDHAWLRDFVSRVSDDTVALIAEEWCNLLDAAVDIHDRQKNTAGRVDVSGFRDALHRHNHALPRLAAVLSSVQMVALSSWVEKYRVSDALTLNRALLSSIAFWHNRDPNATPAGLLLQPHIVSVQHSAIVDAMLGDTGYWETEACAAVVQLLSDPRWMPRVWQCISPALADRLRSHLLCAQEDAALVVHEGGFGKSRYDVLCGTNLRWMQLVIVVIADSECAAVANDAPGVNEFRSRCHIPVIHITPNISTIRDRLDECQSEVLQALQNTDLVIQTSAQMESLRSQVALHSGGLLQHGPLPQNWQRLSLLDRLRLANVDVHGLFCGIADAQRTGYNPSKPIDGRRRSSLVERYDASVNYREYWRTRIVPRPAMDALVLPSMTTSARSLRMYAHALRMPSSHRRTQWDICRPADVLSFLVHHIGAHSVLVYSPLWRDLLVHACTTLSKD